MLTKKMIFLSLIPTLPLAVMFSIGFLSEPEAFLGEPEAFLRELESLLGLLLFIVLPSLAVVFLARTAAQKDRLSPSGMMLISVIVVPILTSVFYVMLVNSGPGDVMPLLIIIYLFVVNLFFYPIVRSSFSDETRIERDKKPPR
ncbi:MAG: hypothetical protein V7727_21815 [Sneathiella sp.]